MLDLSAPAINQLKGEDAENLVSFYMNTPGLVKAHEWSFEKAPETEVAPAQPNVLRTAGVSAPGAGGGTAQRRAPVVETQTEE